MAPIEAPLAIWGGVECTCNRVGDSWFDQADISGHAGRLSDYDAIAALGIRTLRVGLLWERYARERSWSWFDARLRYFQALGVRPIAGLLHHGSGPPDTHLLDPAFPEKLARYAAAVAERYPWIDAYTPVNEPNTTARFSGLYGVWYPHQMNRRSYLRALLHEVKATALSMQAIRRVRTDAQLILTEDVGRIDATAALRSVQQLLDLRRWLPLDLLCGRVDRHHPMFDFIRVEGIAEQEILWFADHPTPPNVIGINYYATSDRFLDHRREMYPADCGSAEGPFVDVEAVRALSCWRAGFYDLLMEALARYRIPVALTEVHLGCSVDEQIRWLAQAWHATRRAQRVGANCAALTIWALLGSHHWNQLVTCANGYYEPGVFDVSRGQPVATELATVAAQIATGHEPQHPALNAPGWWERDDRICFQTERESESMAA